MPSAVVRRPFKTAEELLTAIRRSNEQWWPMGADWSPWVFRGIGDADHWTLTPSAWRSTGNSLEPLLGQIRVASLGLPEADGGIELVRQRYEWESAEIEALFQFAELANGSGFPVPPSSFGSGQSPLHNQQLVKMGNGLDMWNGRAEIASLAQHHGIPTRLLDWTDNPLVAAFFAASPSYHGDSATICVWAINIDALLKCTRTYRNGMSVKVHRPGRSGNAYLHSQGGMFTEIEQAHGFFLHAGNGRWPSLEDVLDGVEGEPILIGHLLQASQVPRLAQLLEREGIHNAALMPTLDNVALTVKARWINRAIELQARWGEGG